MPELPEAENIARALEKAICGRVIRNVEVFSPKLRTSLLPLGDAALPGLSFTGVRRRGRYVLADLSDGRALLFHFGMSGVVRVESGTVPKRKHEHVFIHLDDGRILRFEDPRRFGLLECVTLGDDGLPQCLEQLGAEPLEDKFNASWLHDAAQRHHKPVKLLLMDNAVVTGIGNIYANEALFAAGVNPLTPGCDLDLDQCRRIADCVKAILKRAIAAGGSTISDFRNVDGSQGRFARELQIYGKKDQPCPICGTPIQCVTLDGRSTFYCPKCQERR